MPKLPRKKSAAKSGSISVRLDRASKRQLLEAARLRGISVSEYVRTIAVPQARREVKAACDGVICLTSNEQLAFWKALVAVPRLTTAQRRLGALMRGEA